MPLLIAILLLLLGTPCARADELPQYALRYDADARTMQVTLCLAHAQADVRFSGDDSVMRNVGTPQRSGDGTLQPRGNGWNAHDWRAGECLRYTADLGRIADAQARRSTLRGRETITDPAGWLLLADGTGEAEARIELPQGVAISTPWPPLPANGSARRFRIPHTPADWLGRVALGAFAEHTIEREGGRLHVALGAGMTATQRDKLLAWLERIGSAALAGFGRLPLADVQVLVIPVGRQREAVVFGQSARGQGNGVTLFVDPAQDAHAFDRDWVAVHELSHQFHPHLGARGAWLAEGLATYWQNVLRARSGLLTPQRAWAELADGFARGARDTHAQARPLEEASAAMERDHDFTRVYWSGTAYWLDVDIALRRASDGHMSLDEALRRFDACCLPATRNWSPGAFVAKLDALSGTRAFSQRFDTYRALRTFPNVASSFEALGLRAADASPLADAGAPNARLRRTIMAPLQPRPVPRAGEGRQEHLHAHASGRP
jgi:hypothetical protein